MTILVGPDSGTAGVEPAAPRAAARPVPFWIEAPAARDVRISGDFSGWSRSGVRLHPDGHGLWRALLSLPRGVYEYRLLIDGVWADPPDAARHVRNDFGSRNGVLVVT